MDRDLAFVVEWGGGVLAHIMAAAAADEASARAAATLAVLASLEAGLGLGTLAAPRPSPRFGSAAPAAGDPHFQKRFLATLRAVLESITGLGQPGISSNPSTSLKSSSFSMILEPLILASRVLDD